MGMSVNSLWGRVGYFGAIAAGAAMLIWPYSLIAEIVLCACIFMCLITLEIFIVSKIKDPVWNIRSSIISGIVSGAYIALSTAYFLGFIGSVYPATQKLVYQQAGRIKKLSAENTQLKDDLTHTKAVLADTTRTLTNPATFSFGKPSYYIPTSLRIQFGTDGTAREIEGANVLWSGSSVKQAREISHNDSPAPISVSSCPSLGPSYSPDLLGETAIPETPITPTCQCPRIVVYDTADALILFVSFLVPISTQDIQFDPYGASLPAHHVVSLNNRTAIIWFDAAPTNVAVNIVFTQRTGPTKTR